jgi:hypothetical protein
MNKKKPGRGPKISNEVRRLIISQAIHDSKNMPRRALAVRLQDLIEKMGEISPTEDTLARMISEARNQQPSEIDQLWSIGASACHEIPADIIPILVKLQKLRAGKVGALGEITIREAKWASLLYQAAKPITDKLFIDEEGSLWLFSLIVSAYAQRERVSEQMNEQYPKTSDFDKLYFANEDLENSQEAWWSTFPPRLQQAIANVLEERRASALRNLEKERGRSLTDEETEIINLGFDIVKKDGPLAFREWVKQHPLMQETKMANIFWMEIYSIAWRREYTDERQNNQTQGL